MVIAKQVGLELVGLSGLEPLTSRLSGVCSNHLSYRPLSAHQPSGRQPRTGNPEGQPIGSTEHIRGRKRNEAGAGPDGPPRAMSGKRGAAEAAGPFVPTSNREAFTEAKANQGSTLERR